MRKLLAAAVLLCLTGCVSLGSRPRLVKDADTKEPGQFKIAGNVVTIVGNPVLTCYRVFGNDQVVIAEGYFVYEDSDGSLLIDEFGKDFVVVHHPICDLGPQDK